jgi:purine catabolism regulator
LAGAGGLDRPVTGVNVLEAPDIANWLGSNDLVLTTGYAFREEPAILTEVVRQLNDRHASGLGVKLNRFLTSLPEETLRLADELDFPILSIPYDTKWISIIDKVTSGILRLQADLLDRAEEIHRSLCDLLLSDCSLSDIVNGFARVCGCRAALVEPTGTILSVSKSFPSAEIRQLRERLGQAVRRDGEPSPAEPAILTIEGRQYSSLPVLLSPSRCHSYLVCEQMNDYLTDYVARSVVTFISLQAQKMQTNEHISARVRDDFLRDLLDGSLHAPTEAFRKRTQAFGWDLDRGAAVIAVALPRFTEITASLEGDEEIQLFMEQIRSALREVAEGPVVVAGGHAIILQSPSRGARPEKGAVQAAEAAIGELRQVVDYPCSAGIGSFGELPEVHRSYSEAKEALTIGLRLKGPGHVTHYSELGVYRVLRTDDRATVGFCREYLQPLIDYDKEHNASLIGTLNAYFAAGRDVKATSKALFLHYQTVHYRLRKAFQLLGINPSEPEAILNLQIALKIAAVEGLAGGPPV